MALSRPGARTLKQTADQINMERRRARGTDEETYQFFKKIIEAYLLVDHEMFLFVSGCRSSHKLKLVSFTVITRNDLST